MKSDEIGFAVSTMDDASNLEILDITMVIAKDDKTAMSVDDSQNGWDFDKSTGTGGGLSTLFEYTLLA